MEYKNRVLIVEDEVEISELLKKVLEKEGIEKVERAETLKDALLKIKEVNFDLIILDIMLPDGEGYDVLKEVRKHSNIPVLFLSAKDEELDRILGFALGGDDYITKPFSPKEVAYRVKAHLRRLSYKVEESKELIKFGVFKIDEKKGEVLKGEEIIELKPMEFKILLLLAKNKNHIISKDKICDVIWNDGNIGYDNTIMVHIRKLREKIEEDPSKPQYILTVKGLGYKLSVKGE